MVLLLGFFVVFFSFIIIGVVLCGFLFCFIIVVVVMLGFLFACLLLVLFVFVCCFLLRIAPVIRTLSYEVLSIIRLF